MSILVNGYSYLKKLFIDIEKMSNLFNCSFFYKAITFEFLTSPIVNVL